MRVTIFYWLSICLFLLACQDIKDNVAMNRELFLTKTECFANVEGVKEARMAVSTQGPHDGIMYQILTVQAKLKEGISHTDMPDSKGVINCLRPLLDKYPKLTHIGLQYKDGRTEEREKLEAYDVLVSKSSMEE